VRVKPLASATTPINSFLFMREPPDCAEMC
jgi:hypothetical protein